eukprot:1618455-Prymnesium_polylepis.1
MELPKSLRGVSIDHCDLGAQPPFFVSCGASAGTAPPPLLGPGCVLQVELVWESTAAELTLAFQMANVASNPKLRLRRPSLRGTLRLQWEWIREHPYVGRVRFCFVKPPTVDVAVEPLSVVDVTSLPGIGHWIRYALRDNLIQTACYPNWVETDMRVAPGKRPVGPRATEAAASTGLTAATMQQVAAAAGAASALSHASNKSPSTQTCKTEVRTLPSVQADYRAVCGSSHAARCGMWGQSAGLVPVVVCVCPHPRRCRESRLASSALRSAVETGVNVVDHGTTNMSRDATADATARALCDQHAATLLVFRP